MKNLTVQEKAARYDWMARRCTNVDLQADVKTQQWSFSKESLSMPTNHFSDVRRFDDALSWFMESVDGSQRRVK